MATGWETNVLQNCLGLRRAEEVLVLVDEPLRRAGEALCAAAQELGAGRVSMLLPSLVGRRLTPISQDLLGRVASADVIVSLFSTLDLHAETAIIRAALAAFREAGKGRWAAGAQISEEILGQDLVADYHEVARIAADVAERLRGVDEVRLESDAGTDLTFRIGGRPVHVDTGILVEPGSFGNLPSGEVFVAPHEYSADGRLIVDLSLGHLALKRPVEMQFAHGGVVTMSGGENATELRRLLAKDPSRWTIGEFGLGANPHIRIRGLVTTDEKVLGTVHVALGANRTFGGQNRADTHYDCVIGAPRVYLDGRRMFLNRFME